MPEKSRRQQSLIPVPAIHEQELSMHTTQLDFARAGIITDKMKQAAEAEGVTPEFIRDGIAEGTIIICHNLKHANGRPLAVGKGLRTKVNAPPEALLTRSAAPSLPRPAPASARCRSTRLRWMRCGPRRRRLST
jgi:hypothetical protein